MFFDNLIIFLNVLEQFAIRVTSIFDFEDLIKYVNKLYFNNNDELVRAFLEENSDIIKQNLKVTPTSIIKEVKQELNNKIINDEIFNTSDIITKLNYEGNYGVNFKYLY